MKKDESNVADKYKGIQIQSNLESKMELQILLDAQKLVK
jgi:hypothetical protein